MKEISRFFGDGLKQAVVFKEWNTYLIQFYENGRIVRTTYAGDIDHAENLAEDYVGSNSRPGLLQE